MSRGLLLTSVLTPVLALVLAPVLGGCGDNLAGPVDAHHDARPIDAKVIDAAPTIDARPGAFSCLGQALPVTAPDPTPLSGKAYTINGASLGPLAAAKVEAYKDGANPVIAMATTAADGAYSVDLPTAGVPLSGHLKFTKATYLDSYVYPPTPVYAATTNGSTLVVNQGGLDLLTTVAQAQDPDTSGAMGIVLIDCNGDYIAGGTVTVKQGATAVGTVRYTTGGLPDKAATQTDSSGYVLVFDVPPGNVDIGAKVGGMTLRAHTVVVTAHAITITAIVP